MLIFAIACRRRVLSVAVATLAPFLAACLLLGCSGARRAQTAPAPVPVIVTTVARRDVPLELHAIGNVDAYTSVQVKAMVGAQLDKAYFKEGQEVHKGQLLFTLDKRQIEADLAKAEADLAKDQAQLMNAQANAARATELKKEGVISQQDYDLATSTQSALEAAVVSDRATVQNQKVQLSYCDIYSPIDGRTGSLQIYPGNLVKANDTPYLIAINQIEPIYVEFSLPEQQLEQVKSFASAHRMPVEAAISGDPHPAEGDLSFIDNAVDTTTGTIKLKATFPNRDRRLWPGQFVDVRLTLALQKNAVVVPSTAVLSGADGQYVYVVRPDMTAENRNVTVSRTFGDDSVIAKGLEPGESVVTDGQVRLQPNAKVQIKSGAANAGNANTSYGNGD